MTVSSPTPAEMAERRIALLGLRNGFAHDCQNLLLPAATVAALIGKRQDLDSQTAELLRVAAENLQRVRDFLAEITGMYAVEELHLEPARLDGLIDMAIAPLQRVASERRVGIDTAGGNLAVLGDQRVLPRAIRELVRNAIDAAPAGSRIEITAERAEDNHIRLHVDDWGAGVSPEDQALLFRPFFTTKARQPEIGTRFGLGLVHCQAIVAAHGGTVAYSRENGRTRFSLHLPAA